MSRFWEACEGLTLGDVIKKRSKIALTIIGSDNWSRPEVRKACRCYLCGIESRVLVGFERYNQEYSEHAELCPDCIRALAAKLPDESGDASPELMDALYKMDQGGRGGIAASERVHDINGSTPEDTTDSLKDAFQKVGKAMHGG